MTTATFIAAQVNLGIAASTPTVIGAYVVPAATAALITGGSICNKTASAATVDISIWNGASDIAFIYKAQPLPANSTLLFAGADSKWTLATGQGIRVNCTQICDAVMGVMQVA